MHPADFFVWMNWGTYSGSIAVDLFFIVSGFLVTGSYLRNPQLLDFAWARTIRIVPAYAVCLLLTAFVLGTVFTNLPLRDYLACSPETLGYIVRNLKFDILMQWQLPGVFEHNPKSAVINGSIWTLPAEVRMYVMVAALGVAGTLRWRALFNIVALGSLVLALLYPEQTPMCESARIPAPGRIIRGRRVLLRQPRLDSATRQRVARAPNAAPGYGATRRSSRSCLRSPKSPSHSGSPTTHAGAASTASATTPTASISGASSTRQAGHGQLASRTCWSQHSPDSCSH